MSVYMQPQMTMPSMMSMHSPTTGAMPVMMGGAPMMPMMAQPIIQVKGHKKKDKRRPPPINIHMQQHRPPHGMHSPRSHRSPRSGHHQMPMSPNRAHSPRSSHSMHSPSMQGFSESMSSAGHAFPALPGHAQAYHHQQMHAMYGQQSRRNDPTSPTTPGSVDTDEDARLRAREGKSGGCCVVV